MYEQTGEGKGGSLVPRFFAEEDIDALNELRAFSENAVRSMGYAADMAGSLARIANSAAAIRQSDNRVFIMSQHIVAKKEMFHDFLTKTFAGRDRAIETLIDQIENGINQNNTDVLLKAMDGLVTIVASSPWPDFATFNKMIDSGDEIVFE
jgi:hypothetical protein